MALELQKLQGEGNSRQPSRDKGFRGLIDNMDFHR